MEIILEINGQRMHESTYEVLTFLKDGSIKIKAVYHNQEGYPEKEED